MRRASSSHNHPAHFLSKGLFDDIEIRERWTTRLYPFDTRIGAEQSYWGSLGTFAEMIRSGTTCFADPGGFHPNATLEAAKKIGIRGAVTRSTSDIADPARPTPDDLLITPQRAVESGEELHERWHGTENGRLRVWFGLRSTTAVSDELCRAIKIAAERRGVGIHVHLATTPAENQQVMAKWGKRSVERYEQLGLLDGNLFAVHMGAINDSEVELIARRNVNVGHCPSASMLGAFGCIAHGKFPELIAAGANIAIGTDAAAISRFLDMVREMYLAACAHKDARADATVMGAHTAMEMATINGAKALLWDDAIGSLEAGKCADLVLIDMESLEWYPRPRVNPVANLVYSSGGHRVDSVMIDGNWVMRNRWLRTIDEDELKERTQQAAREMLVQTGIPEVQHWPVH